MLFLTKQFQWKAIVTIVIIITMIDAASNFFTPNAAEAAPGDVLDCSNLVNVSNTPGFASGDPMLLADKAGSVHLFWAERATGVPDAIPDVPDTLMYSVWNGIVWSDPIDLFGYTGELFDRRVADPRAAIDDEGYLHLVWRDDDTLYYSSGHASKASSASAWQKVTTLAHDQNGSQHSIDIAYESPKTIHIIYGQEPGGRGNQSLSYVRSDDSGFTWSEPTVIYSVPYLDRGISNGRLLVDSPEIYASWTEWDETGNGQAIFIAKSDNSGISWGNPVLLDEREGIEYERDWMSITKVSDGELIAFWEGGFRAYRQAQYSYDGGQTWSEPKDTLDWLISDNGFAEFVRDGSDRLHLFVFNRIREGNVDRQIEGASSGLWHSVWQGGTQWRQPSMVGNPRGGNYVSVVISGGNQVFAASFGYSDPEIRVVRCQIADAAQINPVPWQETIEEQSQAIPQDIDSASSEQTGPALNIDLGSITAEQASQGTTLAQALMAPTLIVLGLFIVVMFRRRSH